MHLWMTVKISAIWQKRWHCLSYWWLPSNWVVLITQINLAGDTTLRHTLCRMDCRMRRPWHAKTWRQYTHYQNGFEWALVRCVALSGKRWFWFIGGAVGVGENYVCIGCFVHTRNVNSVQMNVEFIQGKQVVNQLSLQAKSLLAKQIIFCYKLDLTFWLIFPHGYWLFNSLICGFQKADILQ